MLDAIIKVAKKYNFDIDKSDLKKYLNEGTSELDDDQLLNVAGGGLFPWGLLLLQIFSSGGPAVGSLSPNETANTLPDTSIVQTYNEAQDENALDFTDDSETAADESTGILEGQENVTDANEQDSDTNSQGSQTAEPESTKDTTEAEIEFSLKLLEKLPQKGDAGFDDFLKITGVKTLTYSKDVKIKHSNGTSETLNINEKEVYAQIENTVREIVQKVESRTPDENMSQEDIDLKINGKEISKHYRLSKQMRIAKAIYRWVAKNITYDFESIKEGPNGESLRKPQNAIFVFNQKSGVCSGYANLTNLMMRMAGIPSACVGSIKGKNTDISHAFNLIYLENSTTNHKGWALLDATWGAPESDKDLKATTPTVEELIHNNMNCFGEVFYDDSADLSYSIYERLEEINAAKNPTKMDRVEEYISEVRAISEGAIKKYSDNMVGNVDNVNQESQSELDKINPEYQDIVTFKDFEVFSEIDEEIGKTSFFISATTSLTQDEAESLAKVQIEESPKNLNVTNSQNNNNALSNIKMYFPGFYGANKDLAEANKSILNQAYHKIFSLENPSPDKEVGPPRTEVGGVIYELCGNEGNAYIGVRGDARKPAKNVQIPKDLVDLGLEFVIDNGIESLTLTGDEIINTSESALYLESIDTTNSNKHIAEDGILYEKNADGSRGAAVCFFKWGTEIEGFTCYARKDYRNNKVASIEICNYKGDDFANIKKIPVQLTQFNVPIKIYYGITAVALHGNEKIDATDASWLKTIDITNSNVYYEANGNLYEKDSNQQVFLPEGVAIINNN